MHHYSATSGNSKYGYSKCIGCGVKVKPITSNWEYRKELAFVPCS